MIIKLSFWFWEDLESKGFELYLIGIYVYFFKLLISFYFEGFLVLFIC